MYERSFTAALSLFSLLFSHASYSSPQTIPTHKSQSSSSHPIPQLPPKYPSRTTPSLRPSPDRPPPPFLVSPRTPWRLQTASTGRFKLHGAGQEPGREYVR